MRRTLLLLPALTLVAPLLTSCGEDEADAATLIREAPAAMAEVGSAQMAMTIEVGGETIEAEGAFDFEDETGTMSMELPPPVGGSIDMVFDGTTYYMGAEAFGGAIPGVDADWIRIDVDELAEVSGIDLDALGQGGASNNPTNALEGLEGISEDGIEDLGSEDVRGVPTTHYAAEIDMQAALDQLGEEAIDDEVEEQFEQAYGDEPVPVEIWIDDDGLARRMTMSPSIGGEDASFSFEMYDFGEPVDVQIPSEDEAIDITDLLGGLGGLGGD